MSADALLELGPENRPLALPYGKWHASQWTVDQAAALLLCSVAAAERFGVDRAQWVFPLVADLAVAANAATDTIHVTRGHEGPATLAACTVTYGGMEPKELVAILDTDDGNRVIAKSSDAALMARAVSDELVGETLNVSGNALS
jgi:hypothetical protein